jgi:PEGA domain
MKPNNTKLLKQSRNQYLYFYINQYVQLGILSALSLQLTHCATMAHTATPPVLSFDSNVPDAWVRVHGVPMCKTPCVITADADWTTVTLSAPGYQDKTVVLDKSYEWFTTFNLISSAPLAVPGVIANPWLAIPAVSSGVSGGSGTTTDLASGNGYRFSNTHIYVDLVPSPMKDLRP